MWQHLRYSIQLSAEEGEAWRGTEKDNKQVKRVSSVLDPRLHRGSGGQKDVSCSIGLLFSDATIIQDPSDELGEYTVGM